MWCPVQIYRSIHGVYRCINQTSDQHRYVLVKREGCYPTVALVKDGNTVDGDKNGNALYHKAVSKAGLSSIKITS
jgi:hypothetical protein